MKKIVGFLGMLAMLLFAVQAQAVTLGKYTRGALVPSVFHDGASVDTVVGIICQIDCSSHDTKTKGGKIHWTFYDVNSTHVADGDLKCTDDDFLPFSWMQTRDRLNGMEGYLVFHADANTTISANAFLVDQSNKDAIFIPVIPLVDNDFAGAPADNPDAVMHLSNGIQAGTSYDVRYWIDPTYNAKTTIVVWLTKPYKDNDGKPIPMLVDAWNNDEVRASITLYLPQELNKLCPSTWKALPSDFIDGFVRLTMPATIDGFAYSYISSSIFGAQQTLLAAECEQPRGERPATPSNTPCGCQ